MIIWLYIQNTIALKSSPASSSLSNYELGQMGPFIIPLRANHYHDIFIHDETSSETCHNIIIELAGQYQ